MIVEYKVIRKTWTIQEETESDELISEYLNQLGAEGWELVDYDIIIDYNRQIYTASINGILKRIGHQK